MFTMTCGCVCCVVEGVYPPGVVRCSFAVRRLSREQASAWTVYGRFIGWFIGRFVGNGFPA